MTTHKERGLAPFSAKALDRFPMWYGGDPQTTQNIVDFLGAKDENDALYNILGNDYKTYRPKYVGPALKEYDDGSQDTVWGVRREGYFYGQAKTHPLDDSLSSRSLSKKVDGETRCLCLPDPVLNRVSISSNTVIAVSVQKIISERAF